MTGVLEASDVSILVGISVGVLTVIALSWQISRQAHGAFQTAVREELDTHFTKTVEPLIRDLDGKVAEITEQLRTNGGTSIRDVIQRTEAKVDRLDQALVVATVERADTDAKVADIQETVRPHPDEGAP